MHEACEVCDYRRSLANRAQRKAFGKELDRVLAAPLGDGLKIAVGERAGGHGTLWIGRESVERHRGGRSIV
jgi:hypothetical protein